jgi:hypothetical protein
LKLKEKEMTKEIEWRYEEHSKMYGYEIAYHVFVLSFNEEKDEWYLSGQGIAPYHEPKICINKEEASKMVMKVAEKLYKELKEFFE